MTSKEALERLYDGFQDGMAGRSFFDIIKQDLERLEKLKNLEEELGIDLITLFKALKEGIFALNDDYECVSGLVKIIGREIDLNIFLKRLEVKFVGCWNLSDYKKTWALTREELENE